VAWIFFDATFWEGVLWAAAVGAVMGGLVAGPIIVLGFMHRHGWPGLGLIKGLIVTVKHLPQRSITQEYPEERPDLPARTRGVIALKQENCTVCYKCARECPDWCIYIDAHKETHDPASGGRARSAKVLDRFAIDYALCMYCGICVEVCPFDALFWTPEFEYAEYSIVNLIHEKERLEEWTYTVLPPPALEDGATPPPEEAPEPVKAPAAATAAPAAPAPAAAAAPTPEQATPSVAAAGERAVAPTAAGSHGERVEVEPVEPDAETYQRVLAEQLAAGKDRRVAEGQAKRAAMLEARRRAGGG
jgi:NADH-quinone oxidoreductase subunit I